MSETVDLATLAIKVQSLEAEVAKQRLDGLTGAAKGADESTGRLSESTRALVARYVSFAAIGATVSAFLATSVRQYRELETATANLAAKTGFAGDALEGLVQNARDLSLASTQTTADILDATEALEGLVPRLQDNAEGLAEVTRQAVLLSDATGDDLQTSVGAIGQALAQFGGGAAEAARYANVLVAAAQNGAAEVADLAQIMERVGPAAGRAGISLEQTVALIETLANRGIRGREAVGGLSEVLDSLAKSTDTQFSPAIVGLEGALANLAAANLTAAGRTELFGESAGEVAGLLISSRAEVERLTGAVTGTSAAADQAAVRLQTLDAQVDIAKKRFALLAAEVGERLAPYLRETVDVAGDLAEALARIESETDGAHDASIEFGAALRALAVAGLALTNTLGLAVRTAVELGGTLDDVGLLLVAPQRAFEGFAQAFRNINADIDETVDRVERARERLTTPNGFETEAPGPLAAPDAPAGGSSFSVDDAIEEGVRINEARLAAQREAAEQARRVALEAEAARLEQLAKFEDDTLAALSESVNAQVELFIAGEREKFLAAEQTQQDIENMRLERQEYLLEQQRAFFETELEATMQAFDEKEAALEEYFAGVSYPAEEERQRKLRQLAEQRERAVSEVARRGTITRDDFDKLSGRQKTEFLLGEATRLTAGLAQHNKAAFEANKAVAIASAVVNTAQGATKALADWGFPLGPIFAALIVASGLAQINAIRQQTYQGGGGGTVPSTVGGTASSNGAPVPTETTAPPPQIGGERGAGRQVQIVIAGNQFLDEDGVRTLVERIRSIADDDDVPLFSPDSRQAQDIVVVRG